MTSDWDINGLDGGEQKFADADTIPYTLGSDTASAGDAMAISSSTGKLVLATDTNGPVAGILASDTSDKGDGDEVSLAIQGVVPANVAGGTAAGAELGGSTTGGQLGAGSAGFLALTDEANGFAAVKLP